MPNLEWEVPHTLVSPAGTLDLNAVAGGTGYVYLVQPEYKIVPAVRVTQDNISQQDGSVMHDRYTTGLVASLKMMYAVCPTGELPDVEPACGADLRLMHEGLMVHIHSLLSVSADPNTNQQIHWTPTGSSLRYLTGIQTLTWVDPSWDNIGWMVSVQFESPFPYAVDGCDSLTVTGGSSGTIPNGGTAPYYPVYRVGPSSAFTIANVATGQQIVYGGAAIPGGHFAEINTFNGTIFLDGDSTDLIAGIDPTLTDFFTIPPGGVDVSATGADVTVEYCNAYC